MVGVAILGAGIFAKEAHLPALLENNGNLLAVYSRSTKSANSLVDAVSAAGSSASGITVYSDEQAGQGLDELLQRADINAVIIALPILVQPNVVRKCLAAGKHVLCEKPVAEDVSTAAALIKDYETAYAPKNLVFSIAEQFRYDRSFRRARDIIAAGEIGKLTQVHARIWMDTQPGGKYYETEWRKSPEHQGGFVLDAGVHFIALIRMVTGQEIVETTSFASLIYPHLKLVDTVNAALRFAEGAVGSFSLSFASKKGAFEYIFLGSEGALTITGGRAATKLEIEKNGQVEREENIDGKNMFEEIKAFLEAAATGKRDEAGNPRQAMADVAVIESICSGGGPVKTS